MDRIIGDFDVALARDCVEEPQDRIGVFPSINVPDGAVLL